MQAIHDFFRAWGEADADARATLIRSAMAPEFSYADPRTEAALTSANALIDYVGMFNQAAPGATAKAVSISTTSGMHRATVEFAMPNGMVQMGQYFIETDAQGLLTRLTGFAGMGAPD